jgi:ABC-2 type transport system permease protein
MNIVFSPIRLWAVIVKEFIQMRRDRVTLGMLIMIPIMQLILFGYAINSNPKHLPTVVLDADHTYLSRSFLQGVRNTKYFKLLDITQDPKRADYLMNIGKILFIIKIPPGFSHDMIRGEKPNILLTADATESMAAANAFSAINLLSGQVFDRDLDGALKYLQQSQMPYNLTIHAKYNPELITQYNIVPGLMGVVLTMTMVIITALAITREYERGTMENLLATPVRPIEVMLGKLIPYIIIGYVQAMLIITAAFYMFHVPINGNLILLFLAAFPFIAANLSIGVTFSTLAENQLQATEMSFFFFLPSILLSGFMFPFFGMPKWAQYIGDILPLTYFLRIVRGILLKGNNFANTWPNIWPIMIFMVVALIIGAKRYRQTLD